MPAPQLLLLVEDEELVREMLNETFVEAGFDVFVAGDGTMAIAELEADVARFSVLVSGLETVRMAGTLPSAPVSSIQPFRSYT